MLTLAVEDKTIFKKKDKDILLGICKKLGDLEIRLESVDTQQHINEIKTDILELIRITTGIALYRYDRFEYRVIFKGKDYWLDTLSEKISDRKGWWN